MVKEGRAATVGGKEGPAFGKDLVIEGDVGTSSLGDTFEVTDIPNPDSFLAGESKFEVEEYEVYMLWFS